MSITLLRTEQSIDNNFHSDLSVNGKLNSETKLLEKLGQQHFDNIYTSPFKRALLTITPYCDFYQKRMNIEPGLYNYLDSTIKNINTYHDLSLTSETHLAVYNDYQPFISYQELYYPELLEDLNNRVDLMINYFLIYQANKDNLIVTHNSVINSFLGYFNVQKIINTGELFTISKDMFKVNNNIPSYN